MEHTKLIRVLNLLIETRFLTQWRVDGRGQCRAWSIQKVHAASRCSTCALCSSGRLSRACAGAGGPEQVRFHLSKPEAIPYFRELIAEYNASQDDVEVVLDTASNLQAGFLRGNPPDLGLLNYNMEMARFMERGALSDLGDMPEADRILPEVQELVDQYATYPGRTSVLPYSVMAASVIYNKEIFEEQRPRGADHARRARRRPARRSRPPA